MNALRRVANRFRAATVALFRACFAGKWRGHERDLTDWESFRRIIVGSNLLILAAIAALLLFPILSSYARNLLG